MKRFSYAVCIISILLIGSATGVGQQLVQNSGFENWTAGIPDNWILEPNCVINQEGPGFVGNYCVRLGGDRWSFQSGYDQLSQIYQIVGVIPGTSYDFHFWARGNNAWDPWHAYSHVIWLDAGQNQISIDGFNIHSGTGGDLPYWTEFGPFTVQAPTGAAFAKIRFKRGSWGHLDIDEATFTITQPLQDIWPMLQHDPVHAGFSLDNTIYPPLNLLWSRNIGGTISFPPVVGGMAGNAVYVNRDDGWVYKLDPNTGADLWLPAIDLGYFSCGCPAIAQYFLPLIFVGLSNGNLYALDEGTGGTSWPLPFSTGGSYRYTDPTSAGVSVYIGSADFNVYKIDPPTGTQTWAFPTTGWINGVAASVDSGSLETVWAGASDYYLYAINDITGNLRWKRHLPPSYIFTPAISYGNVYTSNWDSLYAHDALNGTRLWAVDLPGTFAIAYDKVYVSSGNTMYALDAMNGTTTVWSYTVTGYDFPVADPVVANGVVYAVFGHEPQSSKLVALDAYNGTLLWDLSAANEYLYPVIALGKLYITSSGGWVYAYGPALPDLVITSMTPIQPGSVPVGTCIWMDIAIENQGSGNAGPFSLDFYYNLPVPPVPSQPGNLDNTYTGLAAGATDIWQTVTPCFTCNSPISITWHTWGQIDTYDQVFESDETNNLFGPVDIDWEVVQATGDILYFHDSPVMAGGNGLWDDQWSGGTVTPAGEFLDVNPPNLTPGSTVALALGQSYYCHLHPPQTGITYQAGEAFNFYLWFRNTSMNDDSWVVVSVGREPASGGLSNLYIGDGNVVVPQNSGWAEYCVSIPVTAPISMTNERLVVEIFSTIGLAELGWDGTTYNSRLECPATTTPPGILIQRGLALNGDHDYITFPTSFTSAPVIVTSAQYGSDPKIACAVNNTPSGFGLALTDHAGNPVNTAWVQWIAVGLGTPDPNITIKSECALHGDGDYITFSPSFTGDPVIVNSAQYSWDPKIACAVNNASGGFSLALKDHAGNSVPTAWLQTVAVGPGTPDPNIVFQRGCAIHGDGEYIGFPKCFVSAPVIVTSAQYVWDPKIACAVNNVCGGFELALKDHTGNPVTGAWVQWIAVGLGPLGDRGDADGDGNVNVLDALMAINIILGTYHPTEDEYCRSDCNADGVVNILDVVGIVNLILGIGTCPPTPGTAKAMVNTARIWTPDMGIESRATPSRWNLDPYGKSIELPIFIDAEAQIRGAQFRLSYDPEVLTPDDPQLTDRSAGMTVASQAKDGDLTILVYSASGKVIHGGSGPILTVPFSTQDSRLTMHDARLQFDEAILAGGSCQAIPIEIRPISLESNLLPEIWSLEQNYPNPFNPYTWINYQLSVVSGQSSIHTTLKIYNILGQEVRTLVNEPHEPGYYTVTWDGRDSAGREVASGVYFYRLTAGGFTDTKRMVLMK